LLQRNAFATVAITIKAQNLREDTMKSWQALVIAGLSLLTIGATSFAQAPTPAPLTPAPISLAEARAIIEGAIAFARDANLRMSVVVLDQATNMVSSARMDGAGVQNVHFAEGKAYASAIFRQTTQTLADIAKTRPDRYFGIMNMYPGKVYLVGGGVPLGLDGQFFGAVGVAGLPEGVDEKAGLAGIAAWTKLRETMKK
jgi:glc operon protein GlcG